MTGEEFLQGWAAEIVAAGDRHWYQRFYSIVEALEIVDAIDIDRGRDIGQGIRTGLTARTGEPTSDFYLGSRRAHGQRRRGPAVSLPSAAPRVSVRSAFAALPAPEGAGGTNFVSVQAEAACLVCSGPGPAPWPEWRPPEPIAGARAGGPMPGGRIIESGLAPVGPPSPPFLGVVDDRGRSYQLSHATSGASSSGVKRQRWDLRARIDPAPADDVEWLEFATEHGPVRAPLRPPVSSTTEMVALDPTPSDIEHHLHTKIHNQVCLYLLDPERRLEALGVVCEALIAVGAVDRGHLLVEAMFAVDAALAGNPPAAAIPRALAAALQLGPATAPWLGVDALGVAIEVDGASMILEALVGHRDRLALHFLQRQPGPDAASAHDLIVWATDSLGGGYASQAEALGGMEEGAFHFRPALDPAATMLTIHLQGPAHRATIDIDLTT